MSTQSDAVTRLLDSLEGVKTPNHGSNETLYCDYCSEPVHLNEEVTSYVCDWDISHIDTSGDFGLQRMYGPCCDRRSVQWPCKGATELILSSRYTREKTLVDWEVVDISPADDGEPWSPHDVYEAVAGIEYDGHQILLTMLSGMPQQQGPEDIVDFLKQFNVDIRNIVNEDGEVEMNDEKRQRIEEKMQERALELKEEYDENGWPI